MAAVPSASAVEPGPVAAQTSSSLAVSLTTQQIYAILEGLRPKHGRDREARDRLTESETKQVSSVIIKRILHALFKLKLKAKIAESPNADSEELEEELEIEWPFVGRGLDLVSYAGMDRKGLPRARPFCHPDEMLQFKALRRGESGRSEAASSSRGSSSAASVISSAVADSLVEAPSAGAPEAQQIDAADIEVVEESALPLHKATDGSISYESPLRLEAPGMAGLVARMAVVIEDKDSLGNAKMSHKQIGTYVRIAYPIDGCAFGIVFHGLHFRIYQLVPSEKANGPPDLMTWIPADQADGLEDEMSWQESLNRDFPMFCFELSAEPQSIMEPAVFVKFLEAITISIAVAIEKQKTFDQTAAGRTALLKSYNPSLDLLTQPVDFSALKYGTDTAVAKPIRITELQLATLVPPEKTNKRKFSANGTPRPRRVSKKDAPVASSTGRLQLLRAPGSDNGGAGVGGGGGGGGGGGEGGEDVFGSGSLSGRPRHRSDPAPIPPQLLPFPRNGTSPNDERAILPLTEWNLDISAGEWQERFDSSAHSTRSWLDSVVNETKVDSCRKRKWKSDDGFT